MTVFLVCLIVAAPCFLTGFSLAGWWLSQRVDALEKQNRNLLIETFDLRDKQVSFETVEKIALTFGLWRYNNETNAELLSRVEKMLDSGARISSKGGTA